MAKQRDMSHIDPNQVPASTDQRSIAYLKHPEGKQKIIKYDRMNMMLNVVVGGEGPQVTNDKPIQTFKGTWTGDPERIELIDEKFLKRDQPLCGTCSKPVAGQNMGCFAHNGCPYPDPEDPRGRGPGPFNVIIEKDGQRTAVPCYHAYHGTRRGLPTAQVHYLYSGWRIDTDNTMASPSTKSVKGHDEWGSPVFIDKEIEEQVTELGPMYGHHFGKRKQKPKEENQQVQRHGYVGGTGGGADQDEVPRVVNSGPGSLTNAPKVSPNPTVKIGG